MGYEPHARSRRETGRRRATPPGRGRTDDLKPTVRQVYALARALCTRRGEEFPQTRAVASELIERLRAEEGGGPVEV